MPSTTSALPVRTRDGDYSAWYAISARGLFAYDWKVWNGPYELIAKPEQPLTVDQLPREVRQAATVLLLAEPFAETDEIRLS